MHASWGWPKRNSRNLSEFWCFNCKNLIRILVPAFRTQKRRPHCEPFESQRQINVSRGNVQGTVVAPRISEWTTVVSLNINKRSVLVTETQCHIISFPLLNYAVSCHDYVVLVLLESDVIMQHWLMTVRGEDRSMWRKTFLLTSASTTNLNMHWTGNKPRVFAVKERRYAHIFVIHKQNF
jgi:hypothetical protein